MVAGTGLSGADVTTLQTAKEVAVRLASEAGALLRERVGGERQIEHKGTVDLVTDADQAAEKLITEGLRDAFPGFRLIGEEGARGSVDHDYGWVVDPLDGTTNFAHAYPHFAVSICLEYRGEPAMGVVYDPMRDEMFVAVEGLGATLNDRSIHVSDVGVLLQALVATGFAYDRDARDEGTALWDAFNYHAQGARRDGAAALNLAWVAAGRLDLYWERPVQAWDIGAGVVLVREAGGTVTAVEGGSLDLYAHEVFSSNGKLHDQASILITDTLSELRSGA